LVGREFNPLGRFIRFQLCMDLHGILLIEALLGAP
jgi:hypothetical protein